MNNTVCMNKSYVLMLLFALIIVALYQYKAIGEMSMDNTCPILKCPQQPICDCTNSVNNALKNNDKQQKQSNKNNGKILIINHTNKVSNTDPIREYDYRKAFDPLEDPARRVERHQIPPSHVKQFIDIPTRGYPDNFKQVGVLIRQTDDDKNNKIIRLFGRQEFPGSNKYEYYTAVNSGNDQVKLMLETTRNQELYDDDVVNVKELSSEYKVKLHKYDAPKYYPNIV
jgi:hypothetical protein